jgi:hypothetical protein
MRQYVHYKETDDPFRREILDTILSGFGRPYPKNVKIKIPKSINFPVVMDVKLGMTLKEDHTLKVFKNWVLRRIFGSKRN